MADAVAKTSTPDAAAGNPIDVTTVTTGAGVVDRQIVALGDPAANNKATVKAASTAIAATDLPLAVGLHPTSPLPAGTNAIGALTANQSVNVTQFGTNNVATGTGASGVGIPRVTVSNDSSLAANQSVNVNQIGGATVTEGQKTMAASVPVVLASDQTTLPAVAEMRAATLHVTGTAAANTALTITLPAAGVGLFHYITSIQWHKLYNIMGVAAGAGVLITSTNLPGNPVWTTEQLASPLGTVVQVINYQPTTPLKSSVANTATTIVAPLQLQTIWRGNVSYFTGV